MAVIAMTREMATLGKDVAARLAERLALNVVHHELVEHDIAERAGMRGSEVHRFLEGEASLFERWKIDSKRLSCYTAQEILELAIKGNVLIRGWGATYLLQSVPHAVCVRICAPMTFREEVLMRRLGITDRAAAQREITRNDAAHNGTMQKMFGVDWMDATLYAITLNTARVPVEHCVEQIVSLVESPAFQETDQTRRTLADELILARVRAALERKFGSGVGTLGGIQASVASGTVTLTGAHSDKHMIAEVLREVKSVEGVRDVKNNMTLMLFSASSWT